MEAPTEESRRTRHACEETRQGKTMEHSSAAKTSLKDLRSPRGCAPPVGTRVKKRENMLQAKGEKKKIISKGRTVKWHEGESG